MLLGRMDRIALTAELRAELVEVDRAAPPADRIQPVDRSGVGLECAGEQLAAAAGCSRRPYAGVDLSRVRRRQTYVSRRLARCLIPSP